MTIGVYITYRILDIADLSVEGSIAMGLLLQPKQYNFRCEPIFSDTTSYKWRHGGRIGYGPITHSVKDTLFAFWHSYHDRALFHNNLRIMGKANLSLLRMDTVYTWFRNFWRWSKQVLHRFRDCSSRFP